jgi:AcrR family transcriptional regulator
MSRPSTKINVVPEAILDVASKLFIQHGYGGTSMQDIAHELGITRTALYYYFKNKEEILVRLTEGLTIFAGQLASQVLEKEADPTEALQGLILQHAKLILLHPLQFRVVEQAEVSLPEKQRKVAESARRALLDNFTEVIRRGVASGQFRAVDPKVSAFAVIGMCNWTAWWYRADGSRSADDIAHILTDFALRALERAGTKRVRKPGIDESLRMLQEDLSHLTQIISDKEEAPRPRRASPAKARK